MNNNNNTIEQTTLKDFLIALSIIALIAGALKLLFTFPLEILFVAVVVAPIAIIGTYIVNRVSKNNFHVPHA